MKPTILAVDDESSVLESFCVALEDDYRIIPVSDGEAALEALETHNIDLVLLDIMMPGMDGIETLRRMKETDSEVDVIMVTVKKDAESAVTCMKLGARDYICKPFQIEELVRTIERELEAKELRRENRLLRYEIQERSRDGQMVFRSPRMQELSNTIVKIAPQDSTVLITGETGTGKELVALEIHRRSRRCHRPLCIVNCAAIPSELIESELFGHERGAFTSAYRQVIGKFEMASGGTLLLDEISALPLEAQSRLLRVLQEHTIQRVGGTRVIPVDVRVLAITNMDLKEAISQSRFREDLYYRLNVLPIETPPLRERKEDIPLLVNHFLDRFNRKTEKHVEGLSLEAMKCFMAYEWPGNVRELEHLLERLVILAENRWISQENLPIELRTAKEIEDVLQKIEHGASLKEAIRAFEQRYIEAVLQKTGGNRGQAADLLGIHRSTLALKTQQLDLGPSDP